MNINNFLKAYPYLMKANISPILWGQPGIGKTKIVQQIAKQISYNYVYLTFGSVEDNGDVIGLQDRVKDSVTGEFIASKHLRPEWFPTTENNIIFIDEINRMPKSIMQAMLPFILEGKLHTHQLPPNSHVICAANPPDDDHIVNDISDKALMSRLCHVVLEPTVQEWLEYSANDGVDYSIISFIQENPDFLEDKGQPFLLDFVKPNRRSWKDFVAPFVAQNPPNDIEFEIIRGIVGTIAATKFMTHKKNIDVRIKGDEIVNNYKLGAKSLVFKNKQDRIDLLSNAGDEVVRIVKNTKSLSKEQSDNIGEFLLDLPLEVSYEVTRRILSLGRDDINQTIGQNEELINRVRNKVNEIEALKNEKT